MTTDDRSLRSITACRDGLEDLAHRLEKLAGLESLRERTVAVRGAIDFALDAIEFARAQLREIDAFEALDRLLETRDWKHPAAVLGYPRPKDAEILDVCRARVKHPQGHDRTRLLEILPRLEKAVEDAEVARRQRLRLKQGRPDRRRSVSAPACGSSRT